MKAFRLLLLLLALATNVRSADSSVPSVLLFITDDQSYPYASAYGSLLVKTPAFDRVAEEGILFTQAFVASPGCSPSRAALLTGRHIWQLREAGTHASSFPADLPVLPDAFESAGYAVGYTGKGWGPGDWRASGRTRDPAGPYFGDHPSASPPRGADKRDYTANFRDFLATVAPDQPFFFWLGTTEPHAPFVPASVGGPTDAEAEAAVPGFLPDRPEVRHDLRAYAAEIELADRHLAATLHALEMAGRLNNTIVIVTSDNGMPFPRGKANLYEAGTRVPLAIRWPTGFASDRVVDQPVSLIDLAPTLFAATGVPAFAELSGTDLSPLLREGFQPLPADRAVFTARERHTYARRDNLGYPARAIRTNRWLYIHNLAPERWPAGTPQGYGDQAWGFFDVDVTDTKALVSADAALEDPELLRFRRLAYEKRPPEELYDTENDPDCLNNLVADPQHAEILSDLRSRLTAEQGRTGDLRLTDPEAAETLWESYPRLRGAMRSFDP